MNTAFLDHTSIPNHKLSTWMFAADHAAWVLECRIKDSQARGFDASYDQLQLEAMQDLHMFLKMSWDTWMHDIEATLTDVGERLDALEVKTHA